MPPRKENQRNPVAELFEFDSVLAYFLEVLVGSPVLSPAVVGQIRVLLEQMESQAPETLRRVDPQELKNRESFSTRDVIAILNPLAEFTTDRLIEIQWFLLSMTPQEAATFEALVEKLKVEFKKLTASTTDPEIHYCYNRLTGARFPIFSEKDHEQLFFSRVDPLYSRAERTTLREETIVLVLGASTGDVLIQELSKMGIPVGVWDADPIEVSNLTRLDAAEYGDLGRSKAVVSAAKAMGTNPYSQVTVYGGPATIETVRTVVEKEQAQGRTVILVDAIDDLPFKLRLRKLAEELGVDVCMGTNMAGNPMITVETPGSQPFLSDLDFEKVVARLEKVKEKSLRQEISRQSYLKASVKVVIEIIGQANIPTRQMLTFLLMAVGELSYLAQDGVHAFASGSYLAEAVIQRALGRSVQPRSILTMDTTLGVPEAEQVVADLEFILSLLDNSPRMKVYVPLFAGLRSKPGLTRIELDSVMGKMAQLILESNENMAE